MKINFPINQYETVVGFVNVQVTFLNRTIEIEIGTRRESGKVRPRHQCRFFFFFVYIVLRKK